MDSVVLVKAVATLAGIWAARGYVVVFLQHLGSDTSVWEGRSSLKSNEGFTRSCKCEKLSIAREDIPAVLDQLDKWNKMGDHARAGRLNLSKVGMSGHSSAR